MNNIGTLKVTTPTEREILMTRVFDAPRHLVFAALTKPELLKRWFFGPPGWSLAVCEIDPQVGGAYRYVWRHTNGNEMGMAAFTSKSSCRNGSSSPRSLTKPGILAKLWLRPLWSSRMAKLHSR